MNLKSDTGITRILVVLILLGIILVAILWQKDSVVQDAPNVQESSEESVENIEIDIDAESSGLEDIDKDINSL